MARQADAIAQAARELEEAKKAEARFKFNSKPTKTKKQLKKE